MKTKHLKMILGFCLLACTVPAHNGFKYLTQKQSALAPLELVNEASRLHHAQELLGPAKILSNEEALATQSLGLNERIFLQVQKSLPLKYRSQARQITQTLIKESSHFQMDPVFLMAVIRTESFFNPQALGAHGEIGLMQLKPETAVWISKKYKIPYKDADTLLDPQANIRLGIAYFNFLRQNFEKRAVGYVSAYNMGPLNVRRLLSQNIKPQEYKSKVMGHYAKLYARMSEKSSSEISGQLIAAN